MDTWPQGHTSQAQIGVQECFALLVDGFGFSITPKLASSNPKFHFPSLNETSTILYYIVIANLKPIYTSIYYII